MHSELRQKPLSKSKTKTNEGNVYTRLIAHFCGVCILQCKKKSVHNASIDSRVNQ